MNENRLKTHIAFVVVKALLDGHEDAREFTVDRTVGHTACIARILSNEFPRFWTNLQESKIPWIQKHSREIRDIMGSILDSLGDRLDEARVEKMAEFECDHVDWELVQEGLLRQHGTIAGVSLLQCKACDAQIEFGPDGYYARNNLDD